jgi:hypothetical protein
MEGEAIARGAELLIYMLALLLNFLDFLHVVEFFLVI